MIYNGRTYKAKDGVVTISKLVAQSTNLPVSIQIGNNGAEDAVFAVVLSYPEGDRENPIILTEGEVKATQKSGDSDGVIYTYTAAADGVLTISGISATEGTKPSIAITKVNGDISTVIMLEEGATEISVELTEGQTVEINICALTDLIGDYPRSTIKMTVTFA